MKKNSRRSFARTVIRSSACAAISLVMHAASAHAQRAAPSASPTPQAPSGSAPPPGSVLPSTPSSSDTPSLMPPTAAAPVRLSLADAVSLARRNAPSVLAAAEQAEAARRAVGLANAQLLPNVSGQVAGAASRFQGPSLVAALIPGAGSPTQSSLDIDGTVQMRWTIWDFGRTSLTVRAARANAASAADQVRVLQLASMTEAAAAFVAVVTDQEFVGALRATLELRRRELEIAAGFVAAGLRQDVERVRATLAVNNAQIALTSATIALQSDTIAFASALALDPLTPIEIIVPTPLAVDDDPAAAADTAVRQRPEVRVLRDRLTAAEMQVNALRALYRPTLFLAGSAAFGFQTLIVESQGTTGIPPSTVAGPRIALQANAGLSVPIFDGSFSPQIAAAVANANAVRHVLDAQTLAVRTEAAQSALLVRGARQQLAQTEQAAATAAANLELASGRYASGIGQIIELVDAQVADANARITVVRARLQLEAAKIRLLGATGQSDRLMPGH